MADDLQGLNQGVPDPIEELTDAAFAEYVRLLLGPPRVVSVSKALWDYAAEVSKTVDQLTRIERQIAVLNAVMNEADDG